MEVNNLAELVRPALGSDRQFVSYKAGNLLNSGENYGSLMLAVDFTVKNLKSGAEEQIQCVGKMCPPNDWLWDLFNVQATVKKEIAVYEVIVPTLQQFQRDAGLSWVVDSFAKCYGSRISLDPDSNAVDKDSIILLENLKAQGYEVGDRFKGLDLETAEMIVDDLAKLHAVSIAFRSKHQDEFKRKFLPHLNKDFTFSFSEEVVDGIVASVQDILRNNDNYDESLLDKIDAGYRKGFEYNMRPVVVENNFTTIVHGDYWTNNTMVKYLNGKPFSNKMLDYQLMYYGSLACDLIFFLYSSVDLDVLKTRYDHFIEKYHETFTVTMQQLKFDCSLFTFELFLEEIDKWAGKLEFFHLITMLKPIFTLKEKVKNLDDFSESDFIPNVDVLHPMAIPKLCYIIKDFAARGWIWGSPENCRIETVCIAPTLI